MLWREELKKPVLIVAVFLGSFYLPIGTERFRNALLESLYLAKLVCPGARVALPGARFLHRWGHHRVRLPSLGDELSGPQC